MVLRKETSRDPRARPQSFLCFLVSRVSYDRQYGRMLGQRVAVNVDDAPLGTEYQC